MEVIVIDAQDRVLAGFARLGHRHRFDRFLVAQSIRRNAASVTGDRALLGFPGLRTLTW